MENVMLLVDFGVVRYFITSLSVSVLCPLVPRLYIFSCSTQLNMELILLINVKMPTIVGILTFISRINTISDGLNGRKNVTFQH